MKYIERKAKVLLLLDSHETLTVPQLVEELQASPATVRRDILKLEAEGAVARYWGGIRRKKTPENLRRNTLQHSLSDMSHAAVGRYAAGLLKDNQMIFIGSGTTTLAMIPYIQSKNIHVITNGIPQLEALHRRNIQALLLCGFYKEYSRSLVGKETIEMLRGYCFDQAFLGANGIDENLRPLSADEYEDSIKNLCIRNSKSTYLMVDKKKFHRTAYYTLPSEMAMNVTLITDHPGSASDGWEEKDGVYVGRIGDLIEND